MPDNDNPTNEHREELTYRAGRKEFTEATITEFRTRIETLHETILRAAHSSEEKAQTANDTLERLLEAKIHATVVGSEKNFQTLTESIRKLEVALSHSVTTLKDAYEDAVASAEKHSVMRHENAISKVQDLDQKTEERLASVKSLIDLRAALQEQAIAKATEAGDRRFDGVNEFRATLSDQATHFVTRDIMETNIRQITLQLQNMNEQINLNITQLASLAAKVYIGGACLALFATIAQVLFNYLRPTLSAIPLH